MKEINKNLILYLSSISLLALLDLLIILELNWIYMPFLRQFIGLIFITFIPGIFLLRILKISNICTTEKVLYSCGLSLSLFMLLFFIINFLSNIYNQNLISLIPVLILINVITLVFIIVDYLRNKNKLYHNKIILTEFNVPIALLLSFLPFLSIFGTYLMNFYGNNIMILALYFVISIIPFFVATNKISKNLYPFAIFTIGLSLLYSRSLISMYLPGFDINVEYYVSNFVLINSGWNFNLLTNTNTSLGLVIIAPIYSILCGINMIWVLKVIIPFLFALVPSGLYYSFYEQTNAKVAFLSVFFFMATITFFTEMPGLIKQQIAEFFLVLLIMLIVNNNITLKNKKILFSLFSCSLIVSHYGVSYIFLIMVIISLIIIFLFGKYNQFNGIINKFLRLFGANFRKDKFLPVMSSKESIITLNFLLFFFVFITSWYMYISNSSVFITILNIFQHMGNTIFIDFLNPEKAQGIGLITLGSQSILHKIGKDVTILMQIFITVGIFVLLFKWKKLNFKTEIITLSIGSFVITLLGISVPFFASALNTTRLYHLTLFFLAPLGIIGGITLFKSIIQVINPSYLKQRLNLPVLLIVSILTIYFLFNSGVIYEITNDNSRSPSLNNNMDYILFNEMEFKGATWLHQYKNKDKIYADGYRFLLIDMNDMPSVNIYTKNTKEYYIYLGSFNIAQNKFLNQMSGNYIPYDNLIHNKNLIYNNGGSQIYR